MLLPFTKKIIISTKLPNFNAMFFFLLKIDLLNIYFTMKVEKQPSTIEILDNKTSYLKFLSIKITLLGIYFNQNIYIVKNQTKTMFVNQNDSNLEFPIFKSY